MGKNPTICVTISCSIVLSVVNNTFRNPTLLNSTSFLVEVNLKEQHHLNHAGDGYVIEAYIKQVYGLKKPSASDCPRPFDEQQPAEK